jgi:LDH2 family malate/lactate/ureidoglycolate dehydrogenase
LSADRSGFGQAATRSVDHRLLRTFAEQVLEALGLASVDARVTAELLVLANVRGVDSHGVIRLLQYADSIAAGQINLAPDVRVVQRRGATALVDADGGYGFRPTVMAVDTAVELARDFGIGLVGVSASHHFGVAGAYALRAARVGMIGVVTTNSSPVLAPPSGASPVVGNNPIAIAAPRAAPSEPLLVDVSMSQVAYGKIRLAATEGRSIPLGWARDAQGRPTTDAEAALSAHSLEPVGGHKGFALAAILELLGGALTGSPVSLGSDPHKHSDGGVGHAVIAIDPAVLVGNENYERGAEDLARSIQAVPPIAAGHRVYLPGGPEQEESARRVSDGVPLSGGLEAQLRELGERLGVPAPGW